MRDRDHPIRMLLDWLATGGELTDEDLADLPLRDSVDRAAVEAQVRASADEIAAMRRAGRRGPLLRDLTRDLAADVIAVAGPPARRDPLEHVTDPHELAAAVPRR